MLTLTHSLTHTHQERPQNRLRVALLVDSEISSKYTYDLAAWGQCQHNLDVSHLIVQNVRHKQQTIYSLTTHGVICLLQQIAFTAIKTLESLALLRSKTYSNHLRDYNLTDFATKTLSITPIISNSGFVYSYDDSDIRKLRALDFDVLIHCGLGILRGEILHCASFGIISFHHADNRINRGGPAGFWEVFFKQDSTGFIIQQLTDELDNGNVLYRGHFPTQRFFLLNQAALYEKSNYYLKKLLAEIAMTRKLPTPLESFPYFNPLYKRPTLRIQIRYSLSLALAILKKFVNKCVLKKSSRWGVAFVVGHWKTLVMWRGIRIENPPNHFLADPFVISANDKTYCFVEDYDYSTSKGCISVYQLHEKGADRIGEVLSEPFHMSFPYIFEYQSRHYMCPETSKNNDIRLYECEEFPSRWVLKKIIMSNISAADTMIFEKDGIWWLFTTVDPINVGDLSSQLCVYYSNNPLTDKWTPHLQNPIFVDSNKARNGGILFDNECVYRVAQQHGFDMYGKSLCINKIVSLTKTRYVETPVFKIEAKFFNKLKGTHHIHSNGKCTVFDFVEIAKRNV